MAETLSSLRVTVFRLVVSRRSVAGRSYRRRSFWSPRRICPRSTPSGSGPTSMRTLIRIRHRVPRHQRGVLDTSVVIDLASIDANALPAVASITALTLAELTTGPLSSADTSEQARRLARLQWVESTFEPIPFDVAAARAYGRIYAAALASAQKPRGRRAVDLLIAATALSRQLPLYTRNAVDFSAFSDLMEIVSI